MRNRLLELINRILKTEPRLTGARVGSSFQDGNDLVILDLGLVSAVLVTLQADIASTNMIRQSLLTHHQMSEARAGWTRCLLVLPELEMDHPIFMTSRVVVSNLNPNNVHIALVHMGQR